MLLATARVQDSKHARTVERVDPSLTTMTERLVASDPEPIEERAQTEIVGNGHPVSLGAPPPDRPAIPPRRRVRRRFRCSPALGTLGRMPAFLVHGVPDTGVMWNRLREHLGRDDVIAPSLPGFGTPLPDGFEPVKEKYAGWLVAQIEAVGEPVDLVGHDWGSILVQRVASLRPDLVRTLAFGSGPVDREYVWHDLAQMWQTPGVGEELMDSMTPDATALALADQMGADAAAECAAHVDDTMKHCVLALYRSAVHVGTEWQAGIEAVAGRFPVLVCWGADDPYVAAEFGARAAQRLQARLLTFADSGHWWPVTKPAETAAALERLWQS